MLMAITIMTEPDYSTAACAHVNSTNTEPYLSQFGLSRLPFIRTGTGKQANNVKTSYQHPRHLKYPGTLYNVQ